MAVATLAQWFGVPRSSVYYQPREHAAPPVKDARDALLTNLIYEIIQAFPTFGVRKVWAYLRFVLGWTDLNRKPVARIMRRRGWTVHKRAKGGRPRVTVKKSVAEKPDQRWSTDIANVFCGPEDGWCSLVPVLDCCTRQTLGWELSTSARARTAERALETALITRFGYTRGAPEGMTIRHDNGLVFGSRHYRATAFDYRLTQEYITPYTPEENGLCERFIRTLKEECVWQHSFTSIEEARRVIGAWIQWYNTARPHQALGYLSPDQYHRTFLPATAAAA